MHDPIDDLLRTRSAVILDGALATELERRGAVLDDPLWSARCLIESPDLIRAVHLDYFRAGADVATSATYQASFEGFARRGLDSAAAETLMRRAVALAAEARDELGSESAAVSDRPRPLVAASVGPYAAMLADGSEYRGGYSASDAELAGFHRPRLRVLADAGADLLACETLPCLREALVLARLLDEIPDACAWVSFSCRDGEHTSEGEDIGECAAALRAYERVVAVGVNCTAPQHISPLLRKMRDCTDRPLAVYPNSGERYDAKDKSWCGDSSASEFGAQARRWQLEGARLIGGCCRTGPAEIAEVARCVAR
jgi:homocysteine S-methyltransferase